LGWIRLGLLEAIENLQAASFRKRENRSLTRSATLSSRAIEVSLRILNQPEGWNTAISSAREAVEDSLVALRVQFENGALIVSASENRGAI
jgi:hypothetical protein